MANVRVDERTDRLYLDFRYQGKRYREFTGLKNTAANTRYVIETIVRAADRISAEVYQCRAAFKDKPAGQLYANYRSGKRYKRLWHT